MHWQLVMHRAHTVIGLYIAIIMVRLATSGRLQNAWHALNTHGGHSTAAPPTNPTTPAPPAPAQKPAPGGAIPKGVA